MHYAYRSMVLWWKPRDELQEDVLHRVILHDF